MGSMTSVPLRILIAGGGTGGHVTPALALAEEFAALGDAVLLLGSERGLESRLVPAAGFDLVTLPSRQVMGKSLARRVQALAALGRTTLSALRVLRRFRPQLVISVGGYAAAPAVVAATLIRIPLALMEPNAIPGRVHRYGGRFARRIFAGFETSADAFGVGGDRLRTLGVPLRRALVNAFAGAPPRRRPEPPFRLFVFGGSQGAQQINRAMVDALEHLSDLELTVVHQTGEADRSWVADAYARAGFDAEVLAFEPEMLARYRWADLALCRAGALTVAELALAGLPALLVPLPWAADDHQNVNARALERAGAALRLEATELAGKDVAEALRGLFREPSRILEMARCAAAAARPDAAAAVARECRLLAGAPG
jgi:UDP-N-acetylglucosamine--N-acetylmuramyl-(pentapeptide) pyrophosphoryl-undecaprenol N-acetylglucosamine transferase